MSAIGGYFELEINDLGSIYHDRAIALNSGRAAFEYYLRAHEVTKIYIPGYICSVMLEPLTKLDIEYQIYHVNNAFEIENISDIPVHSHVLYANYFGLKADYIERLTAQFPTMNLLIDCTHSFFYRPKTGRNAIYSPRKYFGVPDGGFVYSTKKLDRKLDVSHSCDLTSHLLGRADAEPESYYEQFKSNDARISQHDMLSMSSLTRKLLAGVDYDKVQTKRKNNFACLHDSLGNYNQLHNIVESDFVYPLLLDCSGSKLREALRKNRIYTAQYWPDLPLNNGSSRYSHLLNNLICLPIDQRYGLEHMQVMISRIKSELGPM